MELIIVRHGTAAHNVGTERQQTFAGSSIDYDLSEKGVLEAQKLAEKIYEEGGADLVVCSKLKRSQHTADIIAKKIKAKIVVFGELNEINIGQFAGHTEQEVRELFPKPADEFYEGNIAAWAFPGGETITDVETRLESFVGQLKKMIAPNSKVVLAGHGMLNRALIYLYARDKESLWKERSYSHDRIDRIKI